MRELTTEVWLQLRLAFPNFGGWLAQLLGWINLDTVTRVVLLAYAVAQLVFLYKRYRAWKEDRKNGSDQDS
ncbi:hypothetical protein Axy23_045 [Achromobacter phage vB_AxyP_19-32_Axy23]|uniref:Uncharacterized protein n=1 Tax=Achromobacter phage vB_AxyP_19-32_Axy23 TaxID=2591047 RepID=A0A514CW77_9CAUD|nr:hypothetical protein Axy23_045 [Achromobacter phage vB_AxyP_19-32_Axy23]